MIIRCERCSTLYELDETLLQPEGSPVQCTRCQAVFTARPPAPGRTLTNAPAVEPPEPHPAPSPSPNPSPNPSPSPNPNPNPSPSPSPSPSPNPSPNRPKAARPSPNVYRPPTPPAPPPQASRPAPPRRDPVSTFEARLKRTLTWKRLAIPLLVVLLLAAAWGAVAWWKRRPDPEVGRLRAEAAARLAQDDTASLARAVELADAALARDPRQVAALGDRALARVLAAAARRETDLEPLAEQLDFVQSEREKLKREQPPGWEVPEAVLGTEAEKLEAELAPRRKEIEAVFGQALVDLEALGRQPGGELPAARGLAVAFAVTGDAAQASKLAAQARAGGEDPWADLAEAWLDLRQGPAARDQALPRLQKLVTAHPELIRARWLLARAQAAAGRREEAEATLVGLLAANPRHERAQRLKAQLGASSAPPAAGPPAATAPAPATPAPAAAPQAARPAAPRPAQPAVSQPAPAAAPEPVPEPVPEPEPVPVAPPVVAPPPSPAPAPRPAHPPQEATPLDPMSTGGG